MSEEKIDIMLEAQIKYTEKLWKEKEEAQQRIQEAIEYIKSYLPNYDFDHSNLEKVLEILGDKNEKKILHND